MKDIKTFYNNIITQHPLLYGHQFTVEIIGLQAATRN